MSFGLNAFIYSKDTNLAQFNNNEKFIFLKQTVIRCSKYTFKWFSSKYKSEDSDVATKFERL